MNFFKLDIVFMHELCRVLPLYCFIGVVVFAIGLELKL